MKLKYSVSVDLAELDFNGPKVKFGEDFYGTEESAQFEKKVEKQLLKDLAKLFPKNPPKYVNVECTADDQEDGLYVFGALFKIENSLVEIPKKENYRLSKKFIDNLLEKLIIKEINSKLSKLSSIYENLDIENIEVIDWEIIM